MIVRDKKILMNTGIFGICTAYQLSRIIDISYAMIRRRLRKLKELKLIEEKKFYLGTENLIRITGRAEEIVELNQARFKPVNFYHDLLINEILIYFNIKGYSFRTQRQISKEVYSFNQGQKKHLPDAILINPNSGEKNIALELELTLKSSKRYKQILSQYMKDDDYNFAVYILTGRTASLANTLDKYSTFKHYQLNEIISPEAFKKIKKFNIK